MQTPKCLPKKERGRFFWKMYSKGNFGLPSKSLVEWGVIGKENIHMECPVEYFWLYILL